MEEQIQNAANMYNLYELYTKIRVLNTVFYTKGRVLRKVKICA